MKTITKRKILLAVSGLSPQIVTETMYALVTDKNNPWIPDEVHLLSTKVGCDFARNSLLHESQDKFGQFCREYLPEGHKVKFDDACLHSFECDGVPLSDIRDLEDSALVADTIAAKVWELTKDENTEVHASIAGGRKSMGFLLGYSMSLYGRPQDRLSHVLVSEGFEGSPDFYFPPKKPVVIYVGAEKKRPINTADAEVTLAMIPILHLREKLPKGLVQSRVSFAKLVETMNLSLVEPSIVVDEAACKLICHGKDIPLTKLEFSFYSFVLNQTKENGGFDFNDINFNEYLRLKDPDLFEHTQASKAGSKIIRSDQEAIDRKLAEFKELFDGREDDKNKNKINQFFHDRKKNIKDKLLDVLGSVGEQYAIETIRNERSYIKVALPIHRSIEQ
jgi:CRISPR-associated protein (TIGR02584 family)